MFGHVQNGKPNEERLLHLSHRCVQFDTDQILGIYGSSCNHIIPMFLDDCLAFISSGSKFHFHSFQSCLHEFDIC